ncbi:MAG: hypothetical protein LUF00_01945 [Lachnospiraceae bacterium]|nr:hypothetical protein [Lachnospiraceae bacterium]
MNMKVALCQFTPGVGAEQIENNKRKVREMIEKAMSQDYKPDLIMLPECWSAELDMSKHAKLSAVEQTDLCEETLDGGCVTMLQTLAKKHHVWISGGGLPLRKADGKRYNSHVVINREGEIAEVYDKSHLCEWVGENDCYAYGTGPKPVETEFGIIAPLLCYDIRFEELIRSYCAGGAKFLLVPASFATNLNQWRVLIQARAIENQMFVLACGTCGENPPEYKGKPYKMDDAGQQIIDEDFIHYMGHSMIVDPEGRILAEVGDEECILTAELDTDRVDQVRRGVSYINSLRPQIYTCYSV